MTDDLTRPSAAPALPNWTLPALLLLALALRLVAARGDLWLDEVWSLDLAATVHSALDVFDGLHHDNNHYLNTLWLWLAGPDAAVLVQRLPAILGGAWAVQLAWSFGERSDRFVAFGAALAVAVGYVAVHYGSEARGYGLLWPATIAAALLAQDLARNPDRRTAIGLAASLAFALLAHLTAVFLFAGVALWLGREGLRATQRATLVVNGLVALVPPTLLLGFLWWVDLSRLQVGGAPPSSLAGTARDALALIGGGFPYDRWVTGYALLAGGTLLWVLYRDRAGRGLHWMLAGSLIAALVAMLGPTEILPRYFMVPLILAHLALGRGLATAFAAGGGARRLGVGLAALLLAGNLWADWRLIVGTRGHYVEALAHIAAVDSRPAVTIGGDHDVRVGKVVDSVLRRRHLDRLHYSAGFLKTQAPVDWVILNSASRVTSADDELKVFGHPYKLDGIFPAEGASGMSWVLYRRM